MTYDPKVIEALAYLRLKARSDGSQVSRMINTLDNAGVFAEIDEETGYDVDPDRERREASVKIGYPVPQISTQSAMTGEIFRSEIKPE